MCQTVHRDQQASSLRGFDAQDVQELAAASILHRRGQHRVRRPRTCKFFDGDEPVPRNGGAGRIVVKSHRWFAGLAPATRVNLRLSEPVHVPNRAAACVYLECRSLQL